MTLTGDKQLAKLFNTLGERVQRRVLRSAVNAAGTPVLKAARRNAAKESGTLKKALGKKVKTSKDKKAVTAIIGPRRGVTGTYRGKVRKPSRYAHLVEKGFIDEHGNHVPAQPFLRPALEETQAEAVGVMGVKLAAGIVREAKGAGK
ncbi:MAG TPA: HK97-gp10 family putative phage morphogenesis protein [Tepidisphaeraceae bacterium]|nr:HK97-gp10 family putative phage morphogenesis protein [Tepidisphaeraceae bacterium]